MSRYDIQDKIIDGELEDYQGIDDIFYTSLHRKQIEDVCFNISINLELVSQILIDVFKYNEKYIKYDNYLTNKDFVNYLVKNLMAIFSRYLYEHVPDYPPKVFLDAKKTAHEFLKEILPIEDS